MKLALSLCLLSFCGCGHTHLRGRDVRSGEEVKAAIEDVPVRGFPVDVDVQEGKSIAGELLAVDGTNLYVERRAEYIAIPTKTVKSVTVTVRPVSATFGEILAVWVSVGTASTASHGYWAGVSGPIWLAVGIPTGVLSSRDTTDGTNQPSELVDLAQYARYPQGLPPRLGASARAYDPGVTDPGR